MAYTSLRGAEQGNTPRGIETAGLSTATIEHDRPCAVCSYNLRGLDIGGRCPECGTPIRTPAGSLDRLGDAPLSYLSVLAIGYLMMGFAALFLIIAAIFSVFSAVDGSEAVLGFGSGLLWVAGCGVTALPRRRALPERLQGQERHNDWLWLRVAMLATQSFVPLAFAVGFFFGPTWTHYLLTPALLGLVPLGLYQGHLAKWADDDGLHHRWVGCGIASAGLFAILFVLDHLSLLATVTLGGDSALAIVFGIARFILGFIAAPLMALAIVALAVQPFFAANMVHWARRNAMNENAREERRRERWRRRAEELSSGSLVSDPDSFAGSADGNRPDWSPSVESLRSAVGSGPDVESIALEGPGEAGHAQVKPGDELNLPPRDRSGDASGISLPNRYAERPAGASSSPARPDQPKESRKPGASPRSAQRETTHSGRDEPTREKKAPEPVAPVDDSNADLNPYALEDD